MELWEQLSKENDLFHERMDNGTTWAEVFLFHQKLDQIVMCYATHAIVTHAHYCVPDYMRLNSFDVKVNVELMQEAEQDSSLHTSSGFRRHRVCCSRWHP